MHGNCAEWKSPRLWVIYHSYGQSIMLPYIEDMDKVKSKDLVLAQKLPITDRPYPLANT